MTARRVATALLVLVAFACAAEWAIGRWLMAPRNDLFLSPYGWLFRPGSRYVQSAEGWGEFHANRDGFLDRDLDTTGTRGVAILFGDSFGQGLQVSPGERFSEVTEQLVPGLAVLNAAGAGETPLHYALYAPRFQAAYHPDVLLLQVNDGDLTDMDDTRLGEEARREFREAGDPARVGRGRHEGQPPSLAGRLRRVLRRSALVTFLQARVDRLSKREKDRLSQKLRGVKPDLADVVARPATPHAEAMLDSLVGVVVRVNPRVVLVYVPHIHYFHRPPVVAYPARRAWFLALASRRGLPIVDPTDAMLEEFRRTGEPLHGFTNSQPAAGHLNARGHRVLGECLARELERRGTAPLGGAGR